MINVLMRCRLWDLEEVGLDAALGELHGSLGVSGVVVDVMTPSLVDLRMRSGAVPRVFRTAGGAGFQPANELYERTRCKPLTAEWVKSRNPLEKLIEEAQRLGMEVWARASLLQCARLAERHHEFAMKNVLGDVSRAWLCPSNPDVREYACALAQDLSENYGLAGLVWGDVQASGDWWSNLSTEAVECIGAGGAALMDVCFCESCRQGTPLADAAARVAGALLERSFETGEPVGASLRELLESHDELARYASWQHDSLLVMIPEMGQRTSVPFWLDSGAERVTDVQVREEDHGGVIEVNTRDGDSPQIAIALNRSVSRYYPTIRVGHAGPELVKLLTEAAERKVPRLTLETFGLFPDSAKDVIRQAIRFAKRSAT